METSLSQQLNKIHKRIQIKRKMKTEKVASASLQTLLSIHKIQQITEFEKIEKLFDINDLDNEMVPKILTDTKTILIFDNQDFNEATLIDEINKALNYFKLELIYVNIFYINDIKIRTKLFQKDIEFSEIENKKFFEKEFLSPTILTINPKSNELLKFEEKFTILSEQVIKLILKQTIFNSNGN